MGKHLEIIWPHSSCITLVEGTQMSINMMLILSQALQHSASSTCRPPLVVLLHILLTLLLQKDVLNQLSNEILSVAAAAGLSYGFRLIIVFRLLQYDDRLF